MTLEEAIRTIKAAQAEVEWECPMDYATAFDMAISALQEQDLQPTCNELAKDTNVPCKDTISRRTAIVQLSHNKTGDDDCDVVIQNDIETIKALPPAQPDGIPLEWIDKHLEWLDNCDNDFAQLAKISIRAMVEIWKKDKT